MAAPPMEATDPFGSSARSLRVRLTRGMGAQAFAQAGNLLMQITTVPIFIHGWGVALYGEWLAVSAVPVYLNMIDFGFGSVCATQMTIQVGRGDRRGAKATFQSVWIFTTVVSAVVLGAGVVAAAILPVGSWLNASRLHGHDVFLILAFMIAYIFVGMQMSYVEGGYRCEGRYDLSTFFATCIKLGEFAAGVAVVLAGGSPVAVAAAYAAVRLVGAVAFRLGLYRVSPWIRYGFRHVSRGPVVSLARPAVGYLAFPLGMALNLQGVALVTTATLGPTALAVFATLRTLTRTAFQFTQTISNVIWPEISVAFGANAMERVRELHHRACQVALWITFSAVVVLAVVGDRVVEIWTRGAVHVEQPLFALLLATMVLGAFWWTSSAVLAATNKHPRTALTYTLVNVGALATAYVGARTAGLAGVAGGLALGDAILAVVVPRRSLRLVGDSLGPFVKTLLQPPTFLLPRRAAAALPPASVNR